MSLAMFTIHEVEEAILSYFDKNEKMGLQGLLLYKNGLNPGKITNDFSVNRSTVHRWIKRAKKRGMFGLKCKSGRGVRSFLIAAQLSELKEVLSKPIPTDDDYFPDRQTKFNLSKRDLKYLIPNLG